MRRPLRVLGIAAAVLAAGGMLWAIAGSDMLGRYVQLSPASKNEAKVAVPAAAQETKVAAVVPKAPATAPAIGSREALAIEVARLEAGGASVLAGRSPPNHRVTVLANGREIATAVATDEGQWSIVIDSGINAGPLELTLKSSAAAGGPEVVGTPRQLVVPEARVADAPAARSSPPPVSAPTKPQPQVAGIATSDPASTKAAPARTAQGQTPPAPSQRKSDETADQKALERFAAIVAQAREAAAARDRAQAAGSETPAPATAVPTVAPPAPSTPSPASVAAAPGSPVATAPAATPAATPAPAATVAAPKVAAAVPPTHRMDAADSEPGRVAAAAARAEQAPIPVPITFMTDETKLTENGARAAALLAEYLRLKRPTGISLSGHADARGPDGYNMRLSLRRLETIQRYLRAAGYTGELSLVPRGKRDPYQGIDRKRLPRHQIYQADRRVELRVMP